MYCPAWTLQTAEFRLPDLGPERGCAANPARAGRVEQPERELRVALHPSRRRQPAARGDRDAAGTPLGRPQAASAPSSSSSIVIGAPGGTPARFQMATRWRRSASTGNCTPARSAITPESGPHAITTPPQEMSPHRRADPLHAPAVGQQPRHVAPQRHLTPGALDQAHGDRPRVDQPVGRAKSRLDHRRIEPRKLSPGLVTVQQLDAVDTERPLPLDQVALSGSGALGGRQPQVALPQQPGGMDGLPGLVGESAPATRRCAGPARARSASSSCRRKPPAATAVVNERPAAAADSRRFSTRSPAREAKNAVAAPTMPPPDHHQVGAGRQLRDDAHQPGMLAQQWRPCCMPRR